MAIENPPAEPEFLGSSETLKFPQECVPPHESALPALERDELDALIHFFLLLDEWDKKEKLHENVKPIDNA